MILKHSTTSFNVASIYVESVINSMFEDSLGSWRSKLNVKIIAHSNNKGLNTKKNAFGKSRHGPGLSYKVGSKILNV